MRIIGPDEAAEAIERGDVAPRRGGDQLRYGDRPPAPPAGPRPTLRFPLDASADPSRIERPPVEPAPEPVTGPVELPHWTDPPTGEVPAVLIGDNGPLMDEEADDEVWSSFATSTPRWRDADDDWGDDGFMESLSEHSDEVRIGALDDSTEKPSHEAYYGFEDFDERVEERASNEEVWTDGDTPVVEDADPSDDVYADDGFVDGEDVEDSYGDDGYGDDGYGDDGYGDDDGGSGGDRDMPMALAVGGGLALVAIITLIMGSKFTLLLVTAALALAAVEYFAVLRKVGWESATLLGIAACVAFPLAIYWRGPAYYPLLTFLSLAAILGWYLVGAGGRDPRVLEGTGATLLGITWIGGLGSSAAAMLAIPDGRALLVTAILATVAYDVGGLFIGKAMGHRPLSAASPNKTLEGLIGGMGMALAVTIVVVGIMDKGPWSGASAALILGLGAAVAAPLGDLCQSLLKRDLGVKDMGSILPGHGGVLDRFDGMLFVLPTVLWLTVTVGLS
ncbi:MAG: phosphatidate cytidylyltransferase [Aquihabitans sp.]